MHSYVTILVPEDLLPQVAGELLQFASYPDLVEVVHGDVGREIHAHPEVAEAWYQARQQKPKEEEPAPEKPAPQPAPQPVTRTTAKKNTTSA